MNHHYPDNYHGYGHNAPSVPSMGYSGGYGDPAAMARMVHPREGYQVPHYPMMQQPGGVYNQGGGFIGQQNSNPYSMGGYGSYGMSSMNQPVVLGNRQGDINRMSGGNMVSPYYSPGMPSDAHTSPHHGGISSQPSTYSHSQANTHIQQSHMMSSQGHHSMPGQPSMTSQPIHGQSGQHTHSTSHSLSQVGPHQTGSSYGGQNSPHMMPRAHHVPQHPMRHPTTQQNPQEVADNILQMASSYPSNQTVQVPLKSRPAPYHIPRSPHYSVLHGDHSQTSPNPHLQPQSSPGASCQTSPSPSSSSVKSPTPVLAPIPNPIPSPGISGLRSPCNQGMSPCGTQRSPAHMGSTYSGHSQGAQSTQCGSDGLSLHHGMSPSEAQHYSPCGMVPAHNFSPFNVSTPTHRNSSMYSPPCDPSSISNTEHHQQNYSSPASSSPCSSNLSSYAGTSKIIMGQSTNSHSTISSLHMSNNPLMSLQKLVMLPETQVIDPKSVVNDTCLSSQQDESPKNVNGPAEWLVESSGYSVGCQDQSSSLRSHPQSSSHTLQSQHTNVADERIAVSASTFCTSSSGQPVQKESPCRVDNDNSVGDSSRGASSGGNCTNGSSDQQLGSDNSAQHSNSDKSQERVEAATLHVEPSEQKLETPNTSHDLSYNTSNKVVAALEKTVEPLGLEKNISHVSPKLVTVEGGDSAGPKAEENIGKAPETGNQGSLYSERKNGRLKDDAKCLVVQCRSPSVLSEMPVITNGLSSVACGGDEDSLEQDCVGNGIHARIQNAFNSIVKAKLAHVKRASEFTAVTPCSISVGADERAACERFAFRHNGFCRTLRTSRIICNGRNRNDSTGNGDSDESLENLSENSFGLSESPQDGNRKRPGSAVKRNERKKPNLNSVSTSHEVSGSNAKPTQSVSTGDNGCVFNGNEIVSDEDTSYYEGVDSSDIFINNCSSDESVSSSAEVKQDSLITTTIDTTNEIQDSLLLTCDMIDDKQEEQDEESAKKDIEPPPSVSFNKTEPLSISVSSPSFKRLRRSSGQKAKETPKVFSGTSICNINIPAETIIDLTEEDNQQISTSFHSKSESTTSHSAKNFRDQHKSSSKFRPLILGNRPSGKSPVMVLDKSISLSSAVKEEKVDHTDLVEGSSSLRHKGYKSTAPMIVKDFGVSSADRVDTQLKLEDDDLAIKFQSNDTFFQRNLKEDEEKDIKLITTSAPLRPTSKVQKKKPSKKKIDKSKYKDKTMEKVRRDAEIRDSFKSMRFGRTLDLMKSRRRREQTSLGPFIRVVGKQNAPDSVTVFTQPVHESSLGLSGGKHKHSRSRNALPLSSATTVHMVTNLPTDKAAMVSSSRTISHKPWVCAFCAHHSSYKFLGDLYGPYFKESEIPRVESIAAEESKKSESAKDQRSSDSSSARKSKEPFPLERKSYRISRSPVLCRSSEANLSPPEEVWVHEACALWSPGVFLIGNKLYGLDEAVKDAAETMCSACKSKGAMLGCLHKGCSMMFHFVCAIDKDCYMEEEKFSLLCPKHKGKRLKSTADSTQS